MKIGDSINGYLIKGNIPGAGMAQVFKVEKNGQSYVLKSVQDTTDESEVKRFKREIRLMQSIKDQHVIEVIESDLSVVEPYYIMPLCECSLKAKARNMADDQERLDYSIQFCEGIAAIHRAGITHRDIKPENALIDNGVVKITDLGLGRLEIRDSTTITQWGESGGTFEYMPPEYSHNPTAFLDGTVQGDIFMIGKSLACIFNNGTDPRYFNSNTVHPNIARIIARCIENNPSNRYGTVHEIIDELKAHKAALYKYQQTPKELKDILANSPLPRNAVFADEVYHYLTWIGTDNREMAKSLKMLSTDDLKFVFRQKKDWIPKLVDYFDTSIRECDGWIQFEDVEEFARLARIMIPFCDTALAKQKLLEFSIDFAKRYNRYAAMTIVGRILGELTEEDIKQLYPFLSKRADDLKGFQGCFKNELPRQIKDLLK